jgi:hypothetical protein
MTNTSNEEKPGLDELITLNEASVQSGLSPSQLRRLVSMGTIWGKKLGRNWLTTAKAIEAYVRQVHKPGPKPRTTK